MFDVCGTRKGGGLYREAFETQAEAIRTARAICESFDVTDDNGYQVYQEFPKTRWV
jgi:hypothetical protein